MSDPRAIAAPDGNVQDAFALLAEMTEGFAASRDVGETLERALSRIVAHVGAEAGSLWLVEQQGETVGCRASVGAKPITGMRLSVNEGIVGKSVRENICQQVFDVSKDPDFSAKMDAESGFETRSILCAPMRFRDSVIGAVELINKRTGDGHFQPSDAHLLQVLASSAGLALTNARLAAAQVENERVRRELELAAEIQRGLLPEPRPAPFPLHGVNVPARVVSGDFFDVQELPDDRIAFCVGDVSGKGMNAALLMAKTASLYRAFVKTIVTPGALLGRLNDEVCETATRGMFVTMAAGVLEARRGVVHLANAGHEPPLVHAADGSFRAFPAETPPLGIVAGSEHPELELSLEGGALYLCSDGVTEARRPDGSPLGSEGLRELVLRFASKPLAERIEAIAAEVARLDLRDDLTLLGVSDAERLA